MKTIIYGASGHGKVVSDILRECKVEVLGFIDDAKEGSFARLPILGSGKDLGRKKDGRKDLGTPDGKLKFDAIALGIGDNAARKSVFEQLKHAGHQVVTCIHPNVKLAKTVKVGEGSVICSGAIISSDAVIGKGVIINTGATIDHDDRVGDFVHISPGVHLGGEVVVGEGAWVGIGSSVNQQISIGVWSIVGSGSSVIRDVPERVMAAGVPAVVRKHLAERPQEVMHKHIPLARPHIDDQDIEGVVAVLKSGQLSLGPKLEEFETKFARYFGTKHAVAVANGTCALHLLVRLYGIHEGDEVITSPFSFIASANAILFERAKPVFVDIRPDTLNINEDLIEKAITKRTKAIMPIHIFGLSCDMEKINAIAKKHNLKVIEDACEALGAEFRGKKVGLFGNPATFAFYPNKQMTTGEGGIITTDDEKESLLLKSLRNQGRPLSMAWLEHERLGYNYRLTDIACSLGITQLAKLDWLLKGREEVAGWYEGALKEIPEVEVLKTPEDARRSWFVYVVRVAVDRNALMESLKEKGIPTRAYLPAIHLQPFYQEFGHKEGDFPVCEAAARSMVALPFFNGMTRDEVARVADALKAAIRDVKTKTL